MYSPQLGTFIERDPIESDPNLYRYCGNEPTRATDPSGLEKVYEVRSQDDGTDEITILEDNVILILRGHGVEGKPHKFVFKGKNDAAAFIGCSPGTTNRRISQPDRVPDAPMTRQEVATNSPYPETDWGKLEDKLTEGAEKKAREIAQATGKPVRIIHVWATNTGWWERYFRFPASPPDETIDPLPSK